MNSFLFRQTLTFTYHHYVLFAMLRCKCVRTWECNDFHFVKVFFLLPHLTCSLLVTKLLIKTSLAMFFLLSTQNFKMKKLSTVELRLRKRFNGSERENGLLSWSWKCGSFVTSLLWAEIWSFKRMSTLSLAWSFKLWMKFIEI